MSQTISNHPKDNHYENGPTADSKCAKRKNAHVEETWYAKNETGENCVELLLAVSLTVKVKKIRSIACSSQENEVPSLTVAAEDTTGNRGGEG